MFRFIPLGSKFAKQLWKTPFTGRFTWKWSIIFSVRSLRILRSPSFATMLFTIFPRARIISSVELRTSPFSTRNCSLRNSFWSVRRSISNDLFVSSHPVWCPFNRWFLVFQLANSLLSPLFDQIWCVYVPKKSLMIRNLVHAIDVDI